MKDDVRFPGSVEMECKGKGFPCRMGGWMHPVDPLDPRLHAGPYVCDDCLSGKNAGPVYAIYRREADGSESADTWGFNPASLEAQLPDLDANERYRGVPVTPKRVGLWVEPQNKPN